MDAKRRTMLEEAAGRGKYAPLYRFLKTQDRNEIPASFAEIEFVLGFELPDSARIHRPWWANQGENGGHSHALSWQMAGWKTSQVDLAEEKLVFIRQRS